LVFDRSDRRTAWSPTRSSSIGASPQTPEVQGRSFATSWLRDRSIALDSECTQPLPLKQQVSELSTSAGSLACPRVEGIVDRTRARRQDCSRTQQNTHDSTLHARHHSSSSHHLRNDHSEHHARYHHRSSGHEKHKNHRRDARHHHKSSHGKDRSQSYFESAPDSRLLRHMGSDSPILLTQPVDSCDDDEHATRFKCNGPLSLDMLAAGLWHEMDKEHALSAKAEGYSRSTSPSPSRRQKPQVNSVVATHKKNIRHETAPIPFWEESFF